jgi:hypothetical protein
MRRDIQGLSAQRTQAAKDRQNVLGEADDEIVSAAGDLTFAIFLIKGTAITEQIDPRM